MIDVINPLFARFPELEPCRAAIFSAVGALEKCFRSGGKLLLCGNGGSCSDAQHIAGELMKGFLSTRPLSDEAKAAMRAGCPGIGERLLDLLQKGLPAIVLSDSSALVTAFANDVEPDYVYAQQVLALGRSGDVLLGISTSGNASNVFYAAQTAKSLGLNVVGLTGKTGGKLASVADISIIAPADETYLIQEYHLPIYHAICAEIERRIFG